MHDGGSVVGGMVDGDGVVVGGVTMVLGYSRGG